MDAEASGPSWRILEWFPDISSAVSEKLRLFHVELLHFNKTINLISPRTEKTADLVHFADSIIGSRLVLENSKGPEIYDFGSGNGFPGLVLAAMAPDRKIFMIEKDTRKVEFLKHVIGRMGLTNASVFSLRVEDLKPDSIQIAVSRGFAPVSKALITTRSTFRVGGQYFHMKGDGWVREVAEIPTQICTIWSPRLLSEYTLPDGSAKLSMVLTTKIG